MSSRERERRGLGNRAERGSIHVIGTGGGASLGSRAKLALRPDALTAQSRIFVEEVARWQKRDGGETGSVTFVQRFNATFGAFVHLHVVVLDGVFVRHAETKELVFQEGRAPSRQEIAVIAARVEKRMTRWLRRRDLVDERPAEDRSNEAPSPDPLEACMQMSLFGGTFLRLDKDGTPVPLDDERFRTRGKSPWSAEVNGFNIHGGVTVRADDREGFELLRSCARPPFSLERMSLLADGRIAYRLRKTRKNGATHLVLEPVQLLSRISARIPPPRFALRRFAGVLCAELAGACRRRRMPPRAPVETRSGSQAEGEAQEEVEAEGRTKVDPEPAPRAPRTALGAGLIDAMHVRRTRMDWASLLRRIYVAGRARLPVRRPKATRRGHRRAERDGGPPRAPRPADRGPARRPSPQPIVRARVTPTSSPTSTRASPR